MKYVIRSTNTEFQAIMQSRSKKKVVVLSKILKSGKPGKPTEYEIYGEKNAAEVINRLESLNPGSHWVEV